MAADVDLNWPQLLELVAGETNVIRERDALVAITGDTALNLVFDPFK